MAHLRAAILGTGDHAHYHARAVQALPDVDLVACCDIAAAKADEFGRRYQIPAYTEVRHLADRHSIDIWIVSTPPSAHAANVAEITAVSAQGIGILVEKPPCLTMDELRDMVDAANRGSAVLAFGHHLSYTSAEWIHRLVTGGHLGTVYRISVEWCRRRGIPPRSTFLDSAKAGGGVGMDLGGHLLDLAFWLFGVPVDPVSVTALTHDTMIRRRAGSGELDEFPANVEDTILGHIRMAAPAPVTSRTVVFHASWDAHIKDERLIIEVHGTIGGATLRLIRRDGSEWLEPEIYTELEDTRVDMSTAGHLGRSITECFMAELADLAAGVRSRRRGDIPAHLPRVSAGRVEPVLRALLGAYESANRDGEQVGIALEPEHCSVHSAESIQSAESA